MAAFAHIVDNLASSADSYSFGSLTAEMIFYKSWMNLFHVHQEPLRWPFANVNHGPGDVEWTLIYPEYREKLVRLIATEYHALKGSKVRLTDGMWDSLGELLLSAKSYFPTRVALTRAGIPFKTATQAAGQWMVGDGSVLHCGGIVGPKPSLSEAINFACPNTWCVSPHGLMQVPTQLDQLKKVLNTTLMLATSGNDLLSELQLSSAHVLSHVKQLALPWTLGFFYDSLADVLIVLRPPAASSPSRSRRQVAASNAAAGAAADAGSPLFTPGAGDEWNQKVKIAQVRYEVLSHYNLTRVAAYLAISITKMLDADLEGSITKAFHATLAAELHRTSPAERELIAELQSLEDQMKQTCLDFRTSQ
jgi:hypothetical protein